MISPSETGNRSAPTCRHPAPRCRLPWGWPRCPINSSESWPWHRAEIPRTGILPKKTKDYEKRGRGPASPVPSSFVICRFFRPPTPASLVPSSFVICRFVRPPHPSLARPKFFRDLSFLSAIPHQPCSSQVLSSSFGKILALKDYLPAAHVSAFRTNVR